MLALLFVPLGDKGISIPGIRFYFNMYTGPVYLSALLDVFCIVLIAVLFKEYRIKFDKRREDIPCEKSKKNGKKQIFILLHNSHIFKCQYLVKCNIKLIIYPLTGVDWFAVMVTLFIVFVMYSTVPVLES